MAIRNLRYEGDEILKKKSRDVEIIDEKLQILIDDMIETMHKYNGVGLAAVQVGILKRVFVVDLYDDKGPIVFINPVILKTSNKIYIAEEGCLSLQGVRKTQRYESIKVSYLDINFKKKIKTFKGYTAQIIQHELDHFDGVLYYDHINKEYPLVPIENAMVIE